MRWKPNRYYSINEADSSCLQIVTNLLHSYPLTKGCLDTLGERLQNKLAFGFFDKGFDIIKEGESGRDIFLICTGPSEVLVDGQVVVKMEPPTLVGEKGIISEQSKRSATIRVAERGRSLVVKIPIGNFLKDFSDRRISDDQFVQVEEIYKNMFQAIQNRLFEYIYLQKHYWEETNTILFLLNKQLFAKYLDNKKDPGWSRDIWGIVQSHLKEKLSFTWPSNVEMNVQTLRIGVLQFLSKKYAGLDPQNQKVRALQEWRNLLLSSSERVLKSLPESKKIVSLPNIELFNPSIYRMRLIELLQKLEKRFVDSLTEEGEIKNDHKSFFGSGDRTNEFDLIAFLQYFYGTFNIRNPYRIQAQVAQRIALIAAECENHFNISVIKMQNFLEDVKKRNFSLENEKRARKQDPKEVQKDAQTLQRGMEIYQNTAATIFSSMMGKIKFNPNHFPTFSVFQMTLRTNLLRKQMNAAFSSLVGSRDFRRNILPNDVLKSLFHISILEKGDTIPEEEFRTSYWFFFSPRVTIHYGNSPITRLAPGVLLGGEHWDLGNGQEGEEKKSKIGVRVNDTLLSMVLPIANLPWLEHKNPTNQTLIEEYLPLMQWLFDKHLEHFGFLKSCRDQYVKEWENMRKILHLSQKTDRFEKTALFLPKDENYQIAHWLNDNLNLKIDPKESVSSKILAGLIYDHIQNSVSETRTDLSIEQIGNVAYTQWRSILYEIVSQISSLDEAIPVFEDKPPRAVWDILVRKLTPILKPIMGQVWIKQNPILSGTPELNLLSVLRPDRHESSQRIISIYNQIIETISRQMYKLLLETLQQKSFVAKMKEKYSQLETTAESGLNRADMLKSQVTRLADILQKE